MKAKQYFVKYGDAIWKEFQETGENHDDALWKMFREFCMEVKELIELKHVSTDHGLEGIVKEQNEKWNAVGSLFLKVYGLNPLKRDGFQNGFREWLESTPKRDTLDSKPYADEKKNGEGGYTG